MFCFPNRVSKHFYDLYWENKTYKLREVYCIKLVIKLVRD